MKTTASWIGGRGTLTQNFCLLATLIITIFPLNSLADALGMNAYWQPTGDIAIHKGHRSYVSTTAYSIPNGPGANPYEVHVQARTSVGGLSPLDCPTNFMNLGSPSGTQSLSRPVIAVDPNSNRAAVIVASKINGSWAIFAKWHSSIESSTCAGWAESWEPLPLTDDWVPVSPVLPYSAPAAAFDSTGLLRVQVADQLHHWLFESTSVGPGTANWTLWHVASNRHCVNSGSVISAPTSVRFGSQIVTAWDGAGGATRKLAVLVRDSSNGWFNETGEVPLYFMGTNGPISFDAQNGACTLVVAETFTTERGLWTACRSDEVPSRVFVYRVPLSGMIGDATNFMGCGVSLEGWPSRYETQRPSAGWEAIAPPGSTQPNTGSSGFGHIAFGSYLSIFAASLFTIDNTAAQGNRDILHSFVAFYYNTQNYQHAILNPFQLASVGEF